MALTNRSRYELKTLGKDKPNLLFQCVVDVGVIPHLVGHLSSGDVQVMRPSLRTLGNIVTGTDTQTDAVIHNNAVPVFAELLQHPKMNIAKVWPRFD